MLMGCALHSMVVEGSHDPLYFGDRRESCAYLQTEAALVQSASLKNVSGVSKLQQSAPRQLCTLWAHHHANEHITHKTHTSDTLHINWLIRGSITTLYIVQMHRCAKTHIQKEMKQHSTWVQLACTACAHCRMQHTPCRNASVCPRKLDRIGPSACIVHKWNSFSKVVDLLYIICKKTRE